MRVKTAKKTHYLLQFFQYDHLHIALQKVSRPFCKLAHEIVKTFPDNHLTDRTLFQLLEAKDSAVHAHLMERGMQCPKP
jgi:hypothetical protein